jgi:hypothetical protein
MNAHVCLLVISLACALSTATAARAADEPDPYLVKAKELMDEAEYKAAAKVIRQGLAREELSGDGLVEHYLLEATCYVSLNKSGQARSSFVKLLTINPRYRMDASVSPKVRQVFEDVFEEMGIAEKSSKTTIVAAHIPVGTRTPSMAVPVRVSFTGDDANDVVEKVVVHVRRLGTSEFTRLDATKDEQGYLAEIPPLLVGEEAESYAMEYFMEALDADEKLVVTVGTRGLPLTFLVATRAELAEKIGGDGIPLYVPIAIGAGVATAVVVAGVSAIVAFILLQPKTGSATVTVQQVAP